MATQARNLNQILDQMEDMADGEHKVSLEEVLDCIGERSFGPLLLLPGLAALTPLGVVPGLPTAVAVVVVLVAAQLLIGRKSFWLPEFLLKRTVKGDRFRKSMGTARKATGWVDRILRPERLKPLTGKTASRIIAAVCCVTALAMPPLELVPFGVAAPASAVTAFGLGLTARDGLLVLIGLAMASVTIGLVVYALFLR